MSSMLSGAEYLASIFGTEKDKVNCSFYFKIGACRHGDKCSRIHNKPLFSQTVLLKNLYNNPRLRLKVDKSGAGGGVSEEEEQKHFDDFFEEIFTEMEEKYGDIQEMNVCDNIGEHMIGNVYIKFRREGAARKAEKDMNNRWFAGQPIYAELSPVTDFREACCRQYEMGECMRGGFCNFMHLKPISYELRRDLYNRPPSWRQTQRRRKRRRLKRLRKRKRKKRRQKKPPRQSSWLPKTYRSRDGKSWSPLSSCSDLSDGRTNPMTNARSPSLPAAFRTNYSSDSESCSSLNSSPASSLKSWILPFTKLREKSRLRRNGAQEEILMSAYVKTTDCLLPL